jgi:hypothetical protein
MAKVTFWQNHNYKSGEQVFKNKQAKNSNLNGIDSLKTDTSTYIVIFNENYNTGDYIKYGPSSNVPDLNKVERAGDPKKDWKAQVNSFVMYNDEPSWWNDSGRPPVDIPVPDNAVFFAEDKNYSGDNQSYSGPVDKSDTNQLNYNTNDQYFIGKSITSLKTGKAAWLTIHNDTNFTGEHLNIQNNTAIPDLNDFDHDGWGDWSNQIASFSIYGSQPTSWSMGFDNDAFFDSYPDGETQTNGTLLYKSQDALYRIYKPTISYPDTTTIRISAQVDNVQSMATDDHAYLTMDFNSDGALIATTYSFDGGSDYQIPDQVVKAVDASAEILGALGALESLGISEAVAQEFVGDFDTAVKIFNDVSAVIYKISNMDDGRYYLVNVVAHTINRACAAITL